MQKARSLADPASSIYTSLKLKRIHNGAGGAERLYHDTTHQEPSHYMVPKSNAPIKPSEYQIPTLQTQPSLDDNVVYASTDDVFIPSDISFPPRRNSGVSYNDNYATHNTFRSNNDMTTVL